MGVVSTIVVGLLERQRMIIRLTALIVEFGCGNGTGTKFTDMNGRRYIDYSYGLIGQRGFGYRIFTCCDWLIIKCHFPLPRPIV